MKLFLPLAAACLCAPLAASAVSPYISRVYEYRPAPGQFVNEMPEYEEGDTYETMLAKAGEQLVGDRMPGMVSLGAFGGYVVFGFDHPVVNKPGDHDFKIYGNAIFSDRNNNGGSSEPGIVMVSRDVNGNGEPDDPWYEIAGSEHGKATTRGGVSITYTAPQAGHTPTPDPSDKYVVDTTYIPWTTTDPAKPSGFLTRNTYHPQGYWPEWLSEAGELTFTGTMLADNYEDVNGDGSYFVLRFYEWGYADNLPNSDEKGINIEWAVDAEGKPVALESIDFVRVHTAVCQNCGRLGETSTEVSGAEDLHPGYVSGIEVAERDGLLVLTGRTDHSIGLRTDREGLVYSIISVSGATVAGGTLSAGDNTVETSALPAGVYVVRTQAGALRFIK